jgi:hypothetical protein
MVFNSGFKGLKCSKLYYFRLQKNAHTVYKYMIVLFCILCYMFRLSLAIFREIKAETNMYEHGSASLSNKYSTVMHFYN